MLGGAVVIRNYVVEAHVADAAEDVACDLRVALGKPLYQLLRELPLGGYVTL